jgi:tryptophan-rich sensory protein
VLSATNAAWAAVAVCAVAAALEGVCAGRNIRAFFDTYRFPAYSAPLWVWSIIGAVYYAVFGFVVFRLLGAAPPTALTRATLTLIVAMMIGNALSNLVIFRARNLRLSYVIGCVFAGLDAVLLICVSQLDSVAASALVPYLVYRVYAVWWGRALMKFNPQPLT